MSKVPVIYWDACMFYEVLGNEKVDSTKKAAVEDILKTNGNKANYIITSIITHLEVLPAKLGEKGANDEADYLALFDGEKFGEIEISRNILMTARDVRSFYYVAGDGQGKGSKMMDLGDAIHLATAIIHKAEEFHTRDKDNKGNKIPLLKLKEINPLICGKYDLNILSPESDQAVLDLPTNEKKKTQ